MHNVTIGTKVLMSGDHRFKGEITGIGADCSLRAIRPDHANCTKVFVVWQEGYEIWSHSIHLERVETSGNGHIDLNVTSPLYADDPDMPGRIYKLLVQYKKGQMTTDEAVTGILDIHLDLVNQVESVNQAKSGNGDKGE